MLASLGRATSDFVPREDQRHFRNAAPSTHLFCRLALLTGARRGAILDLTWGQVDFQLSIIDFRLTGDRARRAKPRAVVPMSAATRELLLAAKTRAAKSRLDKPSDRVIWVGHATIERRIRWAAQLAGLRDVTAHTLRHTVATWLLGEADVALPKVSAMLGHKSSATTQMIYSHVGAVHLRDAADCLAALLGV